MAELTDSLDGYATIGFDTSPFIYYIDDHPEYASLVRIVLERLSTGVNRGVTSVITMMEISVKPLREQRLALANAHATTVERLPNLTILPIRSPDAWRAGALLASNTLRPADALQLATCIGAGATLFVTNDRRLRQINEIDVLVLDDYV